MPYTCPVCGNDKGQVMQYSNGWICHDCLTKGEDITELRYKFDEEYDGIQR